MRDTSGNPRVEGSTLSLFNLTTSLGINGQGVAHNAGNDAFMCMLDLQVLLDPEGTKVPNMVGPSIQQAVARNTSRGPMAMGVGMGMMPPMPIEAKLPASISRSPPVVFKLLSRLLHK